MCAATARGHDHRGFLCLGKVRGQGTDRAKGHGGSALISESLNKPDMQAVLDRTNLTVDAPNLLLPVLEAISNALHAIEARFDADAPSKGQIDVRFFDLNDPNKFAVSVLDNGIGLTDENFESFKTPFSGYKIKKRGRGFGRFIAFKAFKLAEYNSRYELPTTLGDRQFRFDIRQKQEIAHHATPTPLPEVGLMVQYSGLIDTWAHIVSKWKISDVEDIIASHFLPQFLSGGLPNIRISIDGNSWDSLTEKFKDVFVPNTTDSIEIEIDGKPQTFEYAISDVVKTKAFNHHALMFSAAERIVGSPRDISEKLGRRDFEGANGDRYVLIVVVKGAYLEDNLNDPRTKLTLSAGDIEDIVGAVCKRVEATEAEQIERIKASQEVELESVFQENPILRLGLKGKTSREYVDAKPNNWGSDQFVSNLALERFRASGALKKELLKVTADPDSYKSSIDQVVQSLDNEKREALAEYVVHRKRIIELTEAARKFGSDGKVPPEDVIHDLIFKRFSDNIDQDYFGHNLWMIDDRLSFVPYISSDRTIMGGKRKLGDKVADLLFFDDNIVMREEDGATVTIVEFKKPNRDDYTFGNAKTDPVLQVMNTFDVIVDKGGVQRTDGEFVKVLDSVRKNGFIIADITKSLKRVLEAHDFESHWGGLVWRRYHSVKGIYLEVFGYDTLLDNAKKRNQAFFSVLFGE